MFTERGPYGVGIATLDLGDRLTDVYYPAIPELDAQTEIFDSLSVFPEELQVFIPDELTGEFDTTAYRDAPVVNDEAGARTRAARAGAPADTLGPRGP